MKYRTLGQSDVLVPEISFGCGPTGGLMLASDEAARQAAVERAVELGINLFDTAASYGDGLSERNLGLSLRQVASNTLVATKVTLEWSDFDDIAHAIRSSVEGSIKRLGRDRIDILHLHNRLGARRMAKAAFGSGAVVTLDDAIGPIVDTFRALRQEGKVGVFGVSAFGGDLNVVRQVIGAQAFDAIMIEYNVANPSAFNAGDTEACDYRGIGNFADLEGLGVVALRILGGGNLRAIAHLAEPLGLSAAEYAVRFALSNPRISTALVGFSNIEQIEEAAQYAENTGLLIGSRR